MKTKFVFLTILMVSAVLLSFSGCSSFNSDDKNNNVDSMDNYNFSKEYWGEWVRMDTGENWYISNNKILVNKSRKSGVTMRKQSTQVIEVTEGGRKYYLFASRVNNGQFTGNLASILPETLSRTSRAVSSVGGINIIIGNLGNAADKSNPTSNADGTFTFEGTPGDTYVISVDNQDTVVTPSSSGDDIGTITVANGLNFKVKVTSQSDMQALYAGGLEYDFNIEIENTGTEDCTAARYDVTLPEDLTLISGTITGILRTIEPGKSRSIPVKLKCDNISSQYEFKRIAVRIEDSLNGNVWNDSVSIKFNIGNVNFAIQSDTPVNGVVITPHGKAYYFRTEHLIHYVSPVTTQKCRTAVSVPWSVDDYLVVFSGATADTETAYSFGVNMPNLDDNFTGFLNVMNYEPNNLETQATQIDVSKPFMSYLHKNDIDYYRVNISSTQPALRTLTVRNWEIAIAKPYNNGAVADTTTPTIADRKILPGGKYRMDLEVRGLLPELETTYYFTLSTDSAFITITRANGQINRLTGEGSWGLGNLSSGGRYGYWPKMFNDGDGGHDFLFTVSEDCPGGINIPITITIRDQWGYEWVEFAEIPVESGDPYMTP